MEDQRGRDQGRGAVEEGGEEGREELSSWLGPALSCHQGSHPRGRSNLPNSPSPGKKSGVQTPTVGPRPLLLGLGGCR